MTPSPASSPAPWWRKAWDNRRGIAATIAAVLVFVSPFLPAQYQLPARVAQQLAQRVAGDGSEPAPAGGPSSSSSTTECKGDQVQSVPHFCRCRNGVWTDYFDGGVCGG